MSSSLDLSANAIIDYYLHYRSEIYSDLIISPIADAVAWPCRVPQSDERGVAGKNGPACD